MVKIPFFHIKREEKFLILDIGTEALKVIIFTLKKGEGENKIELLGKSIYYFEDYAVFDSSNFKIDSIGNTILNAVKEAEKRAGLKVNSALVSLPASILKAKVGIGVFSRKNPKKIIVKREKEQIIAQVTREFKKEISQKISEESGILPEDINFPEVNILEIKIDGYSVPAIEGCTGKKLEFRILTTFLPKYYLENISKIINSFNIRVLKFAHLSKSLFPLYEQNINEGTFLDIGGEVTQLFLVIDGKLKEVEEFELGGKIFSKTLSDILGLRIDEARFLKEKYSRGKLSEEAREKIKEIFSQPLITWFKELKMKLKVQRRLVPSNFFIFGGGSCLPEIKKILEEGDWNNIPIIPPTKVKFISPKELKGIQDVAGILSTEQDISSVLISYQALSL